MSARELLLMCLVGAAGCATSGALHRPHSSGSLCVVTASELRSHEQASLLEALSEIRPSLLRTNLHGELPTVILDGVVSADGVTTLRTLSATDVVSVRRLSASSATQRYGLNQSNAVLEVITLRAGGVSLESAESRC